MGHEPHVLIMLTLAAEHRDDVENSYKVQITIPEKWLDQPTQVH